MNQEILDRLGVITDEEREIMNGRKLTSIRPHTRFVHFPRHKHNYIEVIYMCKGETAHFIDGEKVVLKTGDLLFLNQHATQEILPAGEEDIGINFIILPEFFDTAFEMMGEEELTELAALLNYNLYWLSRAIKRLTGRTYRELLQVKRLNQASVLLLNTRLSVTDISIASGYDNTSYFHRIFRNYYGMSPKEYRALNS